MKRTSFRLKTFCNVLALGALGAQLVSTTPANAQSCNFSIADVPDFDQRRSTTDTTAGLPGNGNMYCAPTAFTNWMAYVSNHGLPEVMNGPRDWQSQDNYDYVTAQIEYIGDLMGTDPSDGTTIGAIPGALAYVNEVAPGAFTVSGQLAVANLYPTPEALYQAMQAGGLISLTLGRYKLNDFDAFERVGGHVVSLTQINDACSDTPEVTWHDPGSGGNPTQQALFSETISDMKEVEDMFATPLGWGLSATRWRYERYGDGSTQQFLDSFMVVTPTIVLTTDDQWDTVVTNTTDTTNGEDEDEDESEPTSTDTPDGQYVGGLEFHPLIAGRYYATTDEDDDSSTLYEYDPKSAHLREVMRLHERAPIVTGRHGDLYVVDGDKLLQLDATRAAVTPRPLNTYDLEGAVPNAMVYDDTADELTLLFADKRRTLTLSRNLKGARELTLPTTIELRGAALMANTSLDDTIWLGSDSSNLVSQLRRDGERGWQLLQVAKLPILRGPSALQVSEAGNLVVVVDGYAREFSYDHQARDWFDAPRSVVAGIKAGRHFVLSRSRNNFDAKLMSGPGWNNIAPEADDKR